MRVQVLDQVLEALLVRVEARALRVEHGDDAVRAGEHQLARGVVVDLPRHGEELQAHVHAAHVRDADREKVEVERAVDRRRQADQLAAVFGFAVACRYCRLVVFPAETRAVVDDLEDELASERVHDGHGRSSE